MVQGAAGHDSVQRDVVADIPYRRALSNGDPTPFYLRRRLIHGSAGPRLRRKPPELYALATRIEGKSQYNAAKLVRALMPWHAERRSIVACH